MSNEIIIQINNKLREKLKPLNLREETISGFDEIGLVQNTFWELYELAISTTQEQALAEYRGKLIKKVNQLDEEDATEDGYRALQKVLSLLSDNKIEE